MDHQAEFERLSAQIDDLIARRERELADLERDTSFFFLSSETPPPFSPLADLPPAAPFPVAVLPPPAAAVVEQGASAMGVPPDLIAVPLLALAGAAIGNTAAIRIKRAWVERPILWTAVVARPGTGKSPALALARCGIDALELDARDRHAIAVRAWEEEGEQGPRPLQEDLFTTDSTMEAIAAMLTRTRGMAMIRDELAGWIHSMDAYRKGGDRQSWLSLWAGAPPKVTRKTSDPIFVLDPVLCLTGGIQPDLLPLLLGSPDIRDGLPDRLLLSCPESAPRRWTEADLDPGVTDGLIGIFRLWRCTNGPGVAAPLEPDALARWIPWYDAIGEIAERESGLMEGFLAKAPSHAARLALVLHCFRWPTDVGRPVSAETMTDALALWDYFREHFARAIAISEADPRAAAADSRAAGPESAPGALQVVDRAERLEQRIMQAIAESGPGGVSRSVLTRKAGALGTAQDVGAVLQRLIQQDLIHVWSDPTGGRHAMRFALAAHSPESGADGDPWTGTAAGERAAG